MIVDGLPDLLGLALRAGVEAAHDALQFGEFFDQFGSQVALQLAGRALGMVIAAEFRHQSH